MRSHPLPATLEGPALERGADAPPTVAACLEARLRKRPEGRLSIIGADGAIRTESYDRLWARSAEIAGALQAGGVQAGAIVILLIEDEIEFIPALWACLRAGWTVVPLKGVAAEALRYGRDDSLRAALARLPSAIILTDENFNRLDALGDHDGANILRLATLERGEIFHDGSSVADPVCLIPTSGSTGRVKLAAISQQNFLHRAFALNHDAVPDFGPALGVFPLDSTTGIGELLLLPAEWILLPLPVLMARPLLAFDAIEKFRIASLSLTNSMVARLTAAAEKSDGVWDLGSLKRVGIGAETVVPGVIAKFDAVLQRFKAPPGLCRAGYGSTESGTLVARADPLSAPRGEESPLGACMPGVRIRIVDETNQVLNEGDIGEIQVHCPLKMYSGYWGEPDETRASFTPDGWWRSGDLGRIRAGSLSITGRLKDVLVINGKKYALGAIEAEAATVLQSGESAIACPLRKPGDATERLGLAVVAEPASVERVTRLVRAAIARRFGIQAGLVVLLQTHEIPVTRTGKIDRMALAQRLLDSNLKGEHDRLVMPEPTSSPEGDVGQKLRAIWDETLGPAAAGDAAGDFFQRGGDSLRSVQLFVSIEEVFHRPVDPQAFFLDPTFDNLLRLLREGETPAPAQSSEEQPVQWPLPHALRRDLLIHLETWEGARPTRDRLLVARNTTGARPPLFWVFQAGWEFERLADRLGADQPVYGLRSGHLLMTYAEDNIQILALRYAQEIEEACPDGMLFIGGNCQGAIIAHAAAQHLLRRRRHVASLILMEWSFALQPYAGPVLLMYGRDSRPGNPFKRFRRPERGWDRVFHEYETAEIDGEHGAFFEDAHIGSLSRTLAQHLEAAACKPPRLIPNSARRATIVAASLPERLSTGEERVIELRVRNASPVIWGATDRSGLCIGNYWIDAAGVTLPLDGRALLPELPPGAETNVELIVTAPMMAGGARLVVDVVEDGSAWFDVSLTSALSASLEIE